MTATESAPPIALDAERVNVLHYWGILKRGKLVLVGVTLAFAALGVGAAFVIEPVYQSTVTMVSSTRNTESLGIGQNLEGLSRLAGLDLSSVTGDGMKKEALAILKSQRFVTRFIERRSLMTVLFDKEDFASTKPDEIPTLQDAYEKFSKEILQVDEDVVDNTITLKIFWRDPKAGAEWANALIAEINAHMRRDEIEEAQKSIEYLEKVLPNTQIVQVQQAIYKLIQTQIHRGMLAETREDYAFKVIDPAIPADSDRFVRPRRVLIVLMATLLGVLIASFSVVWRDYIRRMNTAPGDQAALATSRPVESLR